MGSRDEGSSERGVRARLSQRLCVGEKRKKRKKRQQQGAAVASDGRERQLSPGSEFALAVGA